LKIPLKYQSSEYDCAPTTFINALNYVLSREKIDPIMIKTIMDYSLDNFDQYGVSGKGGTSRIAVELTAKWIDNYCGFKNLGISCKFLRGVEVDFDNDNKIKESINTGGVFLSCICLESSVYHYVLVTDMDDNFIYFFDPFSIDGQFESDDIEIISDRPFRMNRKVSRQRFNSNENIYYSLGMKEKREGVLIIKNLQN